MAKSNKLLHSITLGGRELPLRRDMLRITDLKYHPENPRVYSLVWTEGSQPDQLEIEKALQRMDHVKKLIQSILANGGVIDPLLVRESDMVVLEGNSRLSACRALMKEDPVKWGMVKCDVLVDNITDDDVFALLVQYHIVGKKDWDPYEQAGLFWRRFQNGASTTEISQEMEHVGISARKARHMINVYSFMVEHKDIDPNRWSYYDEFLKSQKIHKKREEHPELDEIVVGQIQSGKIERAVDIRKKLNAVCRVGGKTFMNYIRSNTDLDSAYDRADARGANDRILNRLKKFREFISSNEVKLAVRDICAPDKCKFELRRIYKATKRLLKQLDEDVD